ncbi:12497_t:CDS:2 [Funneliformis caledonium]|uniref:Transmembrane protein 188 n=1 Tax=Funneliformis caledonium TaxID=1117310 RepID=A0A9N9HP75_9GLOM|nr:12497_t:CDS:2 [Funneliformis caledonium]
MYTRSRNFTSINSSPSSSFDSPITSTENSPKLMIPSTLTDSVNFSNSSSTIPPSNNHQRFKDLLIFEERLKQNLHQLQRRSYKYEVFVYENKHPTFQFFCKLMLFIAATILVMFFMKNIYAEKVRVATRFVPQCNRVLRQFNMHFNAIGGEIVFNKKVPRKFQEGFERYRQMYYTKKSQRAKEREGK